MIKGSGKYWEITINEDLKKIPDEMYEIKRAFIMAFLSFVIIGFNFIGTSSTLVTLIFILTFEIRLHHWRKFENYILNK